MIIIIYVQSWE